MTRALHSVVGEITELPVTAVNSADSPHRPVLSTDRRATVESGEFEPGLDLFLPISLTELGSDSLLDRVDRKYILPQRVVPELLSLLREEYRVLEVQGFRRSAYTSVYFDTPEYRMYHDHHSGRSPRFKVRLRDYESSGEHYLEVKRRTRGGRTQKFRFPIAPGGRDPIEILADTNPFSLDDYLSVRDLSPVLTLEYDRTTLVGRGGRERVTLDTTVVCEKGEARKSFPGVAILEVKQAISFDSDVVRILRERGLRPAGISKYCLGVASLEPGVKSNRFKPALRKVALAGGESGWST